MSIKALDRLETIHRLNANQSWVNKDLYRLLSRPEFLILAYEQIKSKPGNMTSGEDGETLDGMSYAEIIRISESLKDESFFFKPTRRVEIPKKDGKKRPLGVPSPKDKIVQKAMLMILEAIYDSKVNPTFVDESHGFRGERSCHTALKQIRNWSGITWAIEGDIKGFFDNICHETLIKLIRKRIDDERFINLIWKALRSGFTFEGVLHATEIGTPQGSIISPILANIYLHEYDLKVKQWVAEFEKGKKRRPNPEWRSVHRKAEYRIKKMGYADDQAKSLLKQARSIPTVLVNDPEFIRVKYVRYADDWIIGITGPKALATLIKEKASEFLSRELRLELSQDKTKITHLSTQAARFLGTMIDSKSDLDYLSTVEKEGKSYRRRGITNRIRLRAPTRELLETLREKGFAKSRNKEFIPIHKGAWINLDPDQIVMGYNAVKRGIFNYYSFVDNT